MMREHLRLGSRVCLVASAATGLVTKASFASETRQPPPIPLGSQFGAESASGEQSKAGFRNSFELFLAHLTSTSESGCLELDGAAQSSPPSVRWRTESWMTAITSCKVSSRVFAVFVLVPLPHGVNQYEYLYASWHAVQDSPSCGLWCSLDAKRIAEESPPERLGIPVASV